MNMFLNIQGLCPQTRPSSVPYLKDLTSTSKYLFLGLTETWLTDNHKKGELKIYNYTMFREDRDCMKSKYGRANGVNEALMILSKKFNMLLCVIYRQPTNSSHKSDAPEFIELVSALIKNWQYSGLLSWYLHSWRLQHSTYTHRPHISTHNELQ